MRYSRHIKLVRLKRWVARWLAITARDTLASFTDPSQTLAFFVSVAGGFLLIRGADFKAMAERFSAIVDFLAALVCAVPIYIAYTAIRAIWKVRPEEAALGGWHGHTFVYNQPHHVFTTRVSASDNERLQKLRVTHPERG